MGVYAAVPDGLGALGQAPDHFLLKRRGLDYLRVEVGFWHRQLQHIRRLNIRHLLKGCH